VLPRRRDDLRDLRSGPLSRHHRVSFLSEHLLCASEFEAFALFPTPLLLPANVLKGHSRMRLDRSNPLIPASVRFCPNSFHPLPPQVFSRHPFSQLFFD